jgi:acetyl esterase
MGLPPPSKLSPAEIRRLNSDLSFYWNAGAPPLPHIEEMFIKLPSGRARLRLYDPGIATPGPTAIFLHGGGWVFGGLDTYDGFARQIALRSRMRCLAVEYALAPEHPFPIPLDDCIAAIRWAASDGAAFGIDTRRLVLIGDSAGANLCAAACLPFGQNGIIPVRGAALLYGTYSLDFDSPSQRAFGGGEYFLGTADLIRYANDYLPSDAARENPLAVPMLAELSEFPPLYIAGCEFDPLLDDSKRFAERARTAGVHVEFTIWEGMVHGAVSLMGWIEAMGPKIDEVCNFMRRVTA